MRRLPIDGNRTRSRRTMYATKSGKRFTGSRTWTSACGPSSSSRRFHVAERVNDFETSTVDI